MILSQPHLYRYCFFKNERILNLHNDAVNHQYGKQANTKCILNEVEMTMLLVL